MLFSKRTFKLIILSFITLACKTNASHHWVEQFSQQVKQANQRENIPGYAIAVVYPNTEVNLITEGVTYTKGNPINEHTLFRLASVSKTFTSVLASKLVGEGKLSWDLPLKQLLPETKFTDHVSNNINLEHILSQSSGFIPNAYDNLIDANYSVERVLQKLAKLKPICSPGKCYTYQNTLFAAVDLGLTNRVHKDYKSLVEEKLFSPLKMTRSSVGINSLITDKNWAHPHVMQKNGSFKATRVKPNYYRYASASGINASILDMSEWLKLMLGHYPKVLSKTEIQQLIEPRTKTTREIYRRHWRDHLKQAHYGLGWRIYDFDGEKLIHHGGWVSGYRADIAFAPEHGIGMAFLMNAESNLMNKFIVEFWEGTFNNIKQTDNLSGL